MAYFPVFMDIAGQDILIVGGGTVALRKIEKLLLYEPQITLVAPSVDPMIRAHSEVYIFEREFEEEMLEKKKLVIAATDDRTLNARIAALCREKGIPVNAVDQREDCTFLFPALVKRGELSIGISTGGASPTASRWVKEQIDNLLPSEFDQILSYLDELRPQIKAMVADEKTRARVYAKLLQLCMVGEMPLSKEQIEELIKGM